MNSDSDSALSPSFLELHIVFYRIVAELVEQDVTAVVCVDLVEYHLGVWHLQPSLLQDRSCLLELGHRDPSVLACVDLVEYEPVVGVLSQILDQVFELSLGNIVVSILRGSLECSFSSVECSDEDRFEFKEFWKLDDIPDSLVDFCQAEIAVAVDIEVGPVLI